MEDVFQRIADELPKVQESIERAEVALKALREVGEPSETLEATLRELKTRYARWSKMLEARGMSVGEPT